jgi:hypothetical protein
VTILRRFLRPALWASLFLTAACNPRGRVESARHAIDDFHERYKRHDTAGMYQYSGAAVRSSSSLKDFVDYENNLYTKLGDLTSAELVNYNLLYLLTGAQVRLDYKCQFSKGTAVESFEVNFKNDKPVIDGYRIDSPQLDKDGR